MRLGCAFALLALPLRGAVWVELGPPHSPAAGFSLLARYAGPVGQSCPSIVFDGQEEPMISRPMAGRFTATVCEAELPPSTRSAAIDDVPLPMPRWRKNTAPRVVVIGDTGCRVKQGGEDPSSTGTASKWNIQNCASPADWPFPSVADHAAALHPDLVIHVGDYLYREGNCSGLKNCPGGPAGDALETWRADFFDPAGKLLLAAPWIFVRGNHENCGRAGDGWFTLLDPRPALSKCLDFTEPYQLRAGPLPLVVLDDSTASDRACAADTAACQKEFRQEVDFYTRAFTTISGWKLAEAWLLSHRPVWSVRQGGAGPEVVNAALEAAWAAQRPSGVSLLLAGHTHIFELIGFGPGSDHATQLVIGNSGTRLAPPVDFKPGAGEVQGAAISAFQSVQDFGFTLLTPEGSRWRVEARDREGAVRIACGLPLTNGRCGR